MFKRKKIHVESLNMGDNNGFIFKGNKTILILYTFDLWITLLKVYFFKSVAKNSNSLKYMEREYTFIYSLTQQIFIRYLLGTGQYNSKILLVTSCSETVQRGT